MHRSEARTDSLNPRGASRVEAGGGIKQWYLYLLQVVSVLIFFGVGLAMTADYLVRVRLLGRNVSVAVGRERLRSMFRFYVDWLERRGLFDFDLTPLDRLPDLRGAIVAANHPMLLDAIILISRLPDAVCIMRSGLMRNPSFRGVTKMAGFVCNDSGPAFVRAAEAKLTAGETLLIFPEGTRTHGQEGMNAFKKGFALISCRTRSPVQTVFIDFEGDLLRKGVSLFARVELPLRFRVRLGDRFVPEKNETAARFAARLESYFREHVD